MVDDAHETKVLLTEPAQQRFREHFFRWQCRIRQISVRKAEGRPTSGMIPRVGLSSDSARLTVLISKTDPTVTDQFRFYFKKTKDPAERYDNVVKYLASAYYQQPQTFREELSALCGNRHPVAEQLLRERECTLEFEQYNQYFFIPCRVREAAAGEPVFEATYWHNILFNPDLPPDIRVLVFQPLWQKASAEPPVQ